VAFRGLRGSHGCGISFRHDEEPGRCLEISVKLAQAGITDDAQGLFTFAFAGSVPSDLASGEVRVPETMSLSLTGTGVETIGASFTMGVYDPQRGTLGGTLYAANMVMSSASLGSAVAARPRAHGVAIVGSSLRLSAVTLSDNPAAGELSGTMTVGGDSSWPKSINMTGSEVPFLVLSGPCELSEGGRCVGRPGRYDPDERCVILVGGSGGVLGPCTVFGTGCPASNCPGSEPHIDALRLPDGSTHSGSDFPSGVTGDTLSWLSAGWYQGSWSPRGWVVCFA
jgi:hypothetical protein